MLTLAFQSAFTIINRFLNWQIELFGNSIQVKDIFIFGFLVSLFFIVIKFLGDIT